MSLRVLITNFTLSGRSGSELYVWDLATALLARGHHPIVFSPVLGPLARDLREATVPVVSSLADVSVAPDVIHGHHNLEIMRAVLHFPGVPAVRVCHGWSDERVQTFPRILRYVAVDDTVRDRMVGEWGVPAARMQVLLNFVDLSRFQPRGPLPGTPARALVFSNAAARHAPVVREGCADRGISVDAAGASVDAVATEPERLLGRYDIVFAKARCALEAMACGAAVVLCDEAGVGPLVTTANLDGLRRLNFGIRTLRHPLSRDAVVRELAKYDPLDAAEVCRRVRDCAGLDAAVDALLGIYEDVLDESRRSGPADPGLELRAAADYLAAAGAELRTADSVRFHAYGLLRRIYFGCERSSILRAVLPRRSAARRLGSKVWPR